MLCTCSVVVYTNYVIHGPYYESKLTRAKLYQLIGSLFVFISFFTLKVKLKDLKFVLNCQFQLE